MTGVVITETASVTCDGGIMGGYLAKPPSGNGPGIVLLQEIFGVNAAIRAKCEEFAADGFMVFAPDMFWRITPGLDLGYSEPERQEGFRHLQEFDQQKGVADISAAWSFLNDHRDCTAAPAIAGFCIGGRMAVRAGAALPNAAAIFGFYAVKLDEITDEIASIKQPLRLYFGDTDAHVPLTVAEDLRDRFADSPNARVHIYHDAGHGFFNPVRSEVYNASAAKAAREDLIATMNEVAGRST